VSGTTYDTGALIAAENGDRAFWSSHNEILRFGERPTVPAGVLAEAWRGGPQARLSQLLKGCRIEPLTEEQARVIGALAKLSGLYDIVDLAVAEGAMRRGDSVVTSNDAHVRQVANAAGHKLDIHQI
jgi:predicted nucleic acid-binding protein